METTFRVTTEKVSPDEIKRGDQVVIRKGGPFQVIDVEEVGRYPSHVGLGDNIVVNRWSENVAYPIETGHVLRVTEFTEES